MEETKTCEQCQQTKAFSDFHRRKNKTDGRMRICATCYLENLHESTRRTEERFRALEQQRLQAERLLQQEQACRLEEERRVQEAWYRQQPDRQCIACRQLLPATAFGYSVLNQVGAEWIPKLQQRCLSCHVVMRQQQAQHCCICGKKTPTFDFINDLHGFALFGGGTAIYLCCRACKAPFLALAEDKQRFYIRSRCNIAFPDGQVIYGLFDPEPVALRYVGRTHHLQRRYSEHLRQRSSEAHTWGPESKPYYTRGNWIDDLHQRGLKPGKKELMAVEVAPMAIEWEKRHIRHAIQSGCNLVNHEHMDDTFVARIEATQLNFLSASFEELVAEKFFSPTGIEAFVRAWYRP